jgi:hypothetical protein
MDSGELIFEDLITAIQGAIVKAGVVLQTQHRANFESFFDKDTKKPILTTIKIPIYNKDSVEYQDVHLPTICLVPLSSSRMREFKVKFNVIFSQLMQNTDTETQNKLKTLFPRSFFHKKDNEMAEVEITFEGTEPPEGLMKINDYLVKFFPN